MRTFNAPKPRLPPPPDTQRGSKRTVPVLPKPTAGATAAERRATPAQPASECVFEASEIGMLLEPEDDVLQPSAIGMVLEPDPMPPRAIVRAKVEPAQTIEPSPRVERAAEIEATPELEPAPKVEEPRQSWYPVQTWSPANAAERRWDLVETVETAPAPAPDPSPFAALPVPVPRRRTPKKNPYRAPESHWEARTEDVRLPPRRRLGMWTAISAGASAAVCCVAFLLASPSETAAADANASTPTVIAYDEDLLEPAAEIATAAVASDDVSDRRSHALALALRGRTNMQAGRTKLALSQFHEALEFNAQNRLALAQLGEWHLSRGRAAKASEYLRRAVRVEPRDGKAHSLLGRAYEQLGRPQKAAFHYRAAEKHGHADAKP